MNTDLAATTEIRATCSREDLATALGIVARGLSTRGAVQVLSGILLRGEEGTLSLSSTDMEISLRATIAGDIVGDGGVVVPGRLLTDLCRLLPDDVVTLTYEEGEGVLGVTSGSHSSRLNVYSAEDFPRLPPTDIPAPHDRRSIAARDHRESRAGSLSRRVAACPHRDPRAVRRRPTDHGGDGLVSPGREGDRARGERTRARRDHPRTRAAGARSPGGGRGRGPARRAREPRRLRSRRRVARRAAGSTGSSRTTSSCFRRPSKPRSRPRASHSSKSSAVQACWRSGTHHCGCASRKAS